MGKLNNNFGKIENGEIIFAVLPLVIDGVNFWSNIPEHYAECGYFPVIKTEMPRKEGYYYTAKYEQNGNEIFEIWEEHETTSTEDVATEEQINEAIREGVNSID